MKDFIEKNKIAIGIVIIIIMAVLYFCIISPNQVEKTEGVLDSPLTELEPIDDPKEEAYESPPVIKVDVKGAVRSPGVYIAAEGDRVIDLIETAGSFKKNADSDKVNLAQLVEDQMVIYVPKVGEETEGAIAEMDTEGVGGTAAGSDSNKVNLNTATQSELETLSGIGPAKAMAIIEYRESIGKFAKIEDLKNIAGIGEKTFEKLQNSITVK